MLLVNQCQDRLGKAGHGKARWSPRRKSQDPTCFRLERNCELEGTWQESACRAAGDLGASNAPGVRRGAQGVPEVAG
jgi:hypothetical protein